MTMTYEVIFSRASKRALTEDLPEKIASAAFEFIAGPLRQNPRKVGKLLREPFDGLHSARRGEYRVIYQIFETRLMIHVISVSHRRDAYRAT